MVFGALFGETRENTKIENVLNVLNKALTNTQIKNDCQADGTMSSTQTLDIDNTETNIACMKYLGKQCDFKITGLVMDNVQRFESSCSFTNTTQADFEAELKSEIEQVDEEERNAIVESLNTIMDAISMRDRSSEVELTTEQTVQNVAEKIYNSVGLATLWTHMTSEQKVNIRGSSAVGVYITNNQTAVLDVLAEGTALSQTDIINLVEGKQVSDVETKSFLDSLASPTSLILCAVCLCVVLMIVVAVSFAIAQVKKP